ncbi:MAG: hypothetical protein JXA36_08270 [Coriobacteriia bacterium]|nr:hypothetical protein [Coriobacteriia bacterium]
MLPLVLGLIGFTATVLVASARDPIGFGLLLSSDVEGVAEARLAEPAIAIPPLYVVASALAGAGAVLSFRDVPAPVRWASGVVLASLLLLTMWDLRRRRGTLAVYIRLRRTEIGFEPKGDVIEVPKLVFLVMNQPTPTVWLLAAIAIGAYGVMLVPYESLAAMLPLLVLAAAVLWLWLRNHRSPWEPLARRLRWVSLRSGEQLERVAERALDTDPEVALLRQAADSMAARVVSKNR